MTEPAEEWLSVSAAAARLGISERQARRYAGRLASDDRREAGHQAGHGAGHLEGEAGRAEEDGAGHASGSRPALVRFAAMLKAREEATGQDSFKAAPDVLRKMEPDASQVRPDVTPDTGADLEPDTRPAEAGRVEEGALVEELRDQVRFLRSQLEARDRDAAELRAALREALKLQTRALPEGNTGNAPQAAVSVQSVPDEEKYGSHAKDEQRGS